MKKLIFTILTLVLVSGMVTAQHSKEQASASKETVSIASKNAAAMTWEKVSHNFGAIPQGKPASVTYEFTNNGKEPLIITKVSPTCGCTTDSYSKEAIAPGKKGFVKLTYNAGNAGKFTKSATVLTNVQAEPFTLLFSGEVVSSTTASSTK